jgi:DNA-directed RNA polymerase specialized sigma24 family protein
MNSSGQNDVVDAIRREDRIALLNIYKTYFPQVRHHIISNSGNINDAEDIFQDALVLIYLKIRNNELVLHSTFGTYLIGVVKFLWHKELERKRKYFKVPLDSMESFPGDENLFEDYIKLERRKLIMEHYYLLHEECRKILDLYIKETPISRITTLMGYTSEQYTKNRRTVCKERLVRAIWNNPRFKELKNEPHRQDTEVPRW